MLLEPLLRIEFDPEPHTYKVNGLAVPSVTQALNVLYDYNDIPPQVLERARLFGVAVHKMVELEVRGVLDEAVLDDRLRPYLRAFREAVTATKPDEIHTEVRVGSEKYHYAGTSDLLLRFGQHWDLWDAKTDRPPSTVGPQTAAYAHGILETYGIKIRNRRALVLKQDGFAFVPLKRINDFNLFVCSLNVKRWRIENGYD